MTSSLFGKRILILIPHPDDEVVGCCAAIGQAQKRGAKIYGLYLTHGCLARETMWPWQRSRYEKHVARRRKEAENVAHLLKMTGLNWPVRPARHLWQDMTCIYSEILLTIEHNTIDQIWVPAFEGGNPDHDALNALGSVLKSKVSVLEFAEYHFLGGKAHSQEFLTPNGREQILILTPEEQQKKRAALALYQSEKANLNTIKTRQESYRPIADYVYANAPHEGKLWYTRFQWVPFQHPRVDFTDPKDVAATILSFLKKPSAH